MTTDVRNSSEALFIAVEMERRAVRIYELALLLFSTDETKDILTHLLSDERTHLKRFTEMLGGHQIPSEDALLLSAKADSIIFPGGITEGMRNHAFSSRRSLLEYAIKQEKIAIETYNAFSDRCQGESKDAFLNIAIEEQSHLEALQLLLEELN